MAFIGISRAAPSAGTTVLSSITMTVRCRLRGDGGLYCRCNIGNLSMHWLR
jgi:hypothetical protein